MGRKLKNGDRATAKFIRISDENKWELIDELFTLDKFKSNFNKLINDALGYGLPKLYEAEFGKTEEVNVIDTATPQKTDNTDDGEILLTIVRLLREVIINENVNKSLVGSLFRLKEIELDGTMIGKQFSNGHFQNTPDCLVKYEITELKKLRD